MLSITVFSKPNCPACRFTIKKLDMLGLEYVVRDVTTDPDALAIVQALGYQAVPVVVAGDQHWSGYRVNLLEALA